MSPTNSEGYEINRNSQDPYEKGPLQPGLEQVRPVEETPLSIEQIEGILEQIEDEENGIPNKPEKRPEYNN